MHRLALDEGSRGFITLISMLITGAVAITIAISLLQLGLGASKTSLDIEQSSQAKSLANACAEKALNSLKMDVNYAGNETINLGLGNCNILPVLGSGNVNRTIQVTGNVGTIVRKVKISVSQVQPQIQLTAWQEIADF